METIAFLQRFASPGLDAVMLGVTYLADQQAYIALLVILYLAVNPTLARRVGIALLVSLFLNVHLKGMVDTARPFALDPTVARGEAATATAPGPGFPSGHTQGAATFWGMLAVGVRRPVVWGVAAAVVGLVAVSRLYLGVHLPVDVVGGVVIGAAVVAVGQLVLWYRRRAGRDRAGRQPWPRPLRLGLGVFAPLAVHLALPADDSAMLMGALAAFLTAPLLVRHRVPTAVPHRVAAAAIGLVLVFGALFGTGLLPDPVTEVGVIGYLRFLLIGYTGLVLAPYLVRRLGLTRGSAGGEVRGGGGAGGADQPAPLPLEEPGGLREHRAG